MTKPIRYTMKYDPDLEDTYPEPDPYGEYVNFEDYDKLRTERDELLAEVEQYKFLLDQAKTLRRDNMIFREAIEAHLRNVWGEVDSDHDQDVELYKALDSIDNRSTKAGEDLS